MYEMLTGSVPFQYDDPLEMMHAHIARPPAPLPLSLSSLGELVLILLSKDPDQRYLTPIGLKVCLFS
jgi:histidine kinase